MKQKRKNVEFLTSNEMLAVEMNAEYLGLSRLQMMENAGRGVVSVIEQVAGEVSGKSFAVMCGKGNNGGDGFVVSRNSRPKPPVAR